MAGRMISRPMHPSEPPEGARTAPGDEAFGGFDDLMPRPDMAPSEHYTATNLPNRGTAGIRRATAGKTVTEGFAGGDPMGEDQIQTEGMIGRPLGMDDGGGT